MKQLTFALLWCFPIFLFGQSVDSTTIKQVDSLRQVSIKFIGDGEYEKALKINTIAKAIALEKLGRETESYGNTCFLQGGIFWYMGNYQEAEKWYLDAKSIFEKVGLQEHKNYSNLIKHLAILYDNLGNYKKAESFFLESLRMKEKIFGKNNPDYAGSLVNLSIIYQSMGDYERAEFFLLEAKNIFEIHLKDQKHQYYMASLLTLGSLYHDLGKYEKAEILYLQTKYIIEEEFNDQKHFYYDNCLTNMAVNYTDMGLYDKAERLTLQVKELYEEKVGREHPDYVLGLMNLSSFYIVTSEFDKAEPLLLEAKEIHEVKLNMKENINYSLILSYLGVLNAQLGKYEKAESFFLESLTTREKIQGKDHPDYAETLNQLANNYMAKGSHEKAEPLYLQSASTLQRSLGKVHPEYIYCQYRYADLLMEKEDFENAEIVFSELAQLNQINFIKSLHYLSEQELGAYLKKSEGYKGQTFHYAQLTQARENNISQTCYDYVLFYKGILLNANKRIKRLALSNSTSAETFERLKSYERLLAAEYVKPIIERDSIKLVELEAKSNDLEKEVARSVIGYGEAVKQVKWQEVQQQLHAGEAALEFTHYKYREMGSSNHKIAYAALLLLPEDNQPQFIPLFQEKQLRKILECKNDNHSTSINTIYNNPSLYELLWQPIEKQLAKIKTIYYSPSGLLHRLNLSAIQNDKTLLCNKYNLVQVNSTRELVLPTTNEKKLEEALLFGGIQYNMDTTAIASVDNDFGKTTTRGSLSFSQSDSTLRGDNWNYLDWTEVEVSAIESILKENGIPTNSQVGHQATEEAFKSINQPSPRILHIATHGFFFPDPKQENASLGIGIEQEPVFKTSDHPMIRSGLIMAGGNHAWETGKPFQPKMEDGILTAYEISQMDLSNTELVVLSACDTGLGDIEGNEGVYGLQRAFKIAGAKYLIMSLWQVPDYQTQQLMTVFYNNMLTKEMETPEAFRSAQQEMQEKYEDPFLWAGFVLVE